MEDILRLTGIAKVYLNGVYANKKVDFSVRKGEIHALVGENGAGKSTLMKIIFGIEKPDGGTIFLGDEQVSFNSPNDAINKGICMVHQHFMLIPSLTVAENTALGCEDKKGIFIDKEKIQKRVDELSKQYNLSLSATDRVADISVGKKQRVEILKTLYRNAKIIILDEPTAVLTPQETEELFAQLKLLKEKGHTIIFISHKLHEIKQITDRVSIMRKGEMITTVNTADVNEKQISDLIIGESVNLDIQKDKPNCGKVVLDMKDLCAKDEGGKQILSNINLKLREGQITGLAGIEGNGQSEIVEIITGQRKYDVGRVTFLDEDVVHNKIARTRKKGLGYVPSDRMTMGSATEMTIEENLITNRLHDKKLYRFGFLSPKKTAALSRELIQRFSIKTNSEKTQVKMLSGGNIQKVVAAREFTETAKLIVADQPTRGIDVLAADFIHKTLLKLRDNGCAVLVVSADLEELLKLSDNLIVVYNGNITAHFDDSTQVSDVELGNYMLGAKKMDDDYIRGKYNEE